MRCSAAAVTGCLSVRLDESGLCTIWLCGMESWGTEWLIIGGAGRGREWGEDLEGFAASLGDGEVVLVSW